MEVSYKRDMNHTYLILQGGEKVDTSAYPVRMMLSNQWETFLPCTIQGMDKMCIRDRFLYPLFRFRMIGAGDIKLLSAVGGFMDFSAICWCMFCSFLIGAALSAAVLATCGDFSRRLRYFSRYFHNYFQTGKVVPYRKYGMQPEHIHFSVPVFLSVLLYAGGRCV